MWLIEMSTKDRQFVAFSDRVDREKATRACKRLIRRVAGNKRLVFTHYRAVQFSHGNVAIEANSNNVEWET